MESLDLPRILLFIPYQCMMVYGMFGLASHWSFIHIRQGGDRDIPDHWFLLFGLILPLAGWLMSVFLSSSAVACVLPVSLAVLFYWTTSRECDAERMQGALDDEDLAHANRMILADGRNAAAYWAKAKVCERLGDCAEALWNYRRAHQLCERTVSPHEMAEIELRLAQACESARGEKMGTGPGLHRLRARGLCPELFFFACGLLFLFSDWTRALNVCSLMLFLRWLHSRR